MLKSVNLLKIDGMESFLTIDEIADALKVTRQTVSKYIQKKALNAIKISTHYRVSLKDFEEFLRARSVGDEIQLEEYKNTKNCYLDYPGKTDEPGILNLEYRGKIEAVELQHDGDANQYIFGDNLYVLHELLSALQGKADLVYIDPPFGTGQDFRNLEDDHAYSDRLINSDFLEFIRKRLILLRELLSSRGSIYLHIDKKIGHYVKIIMDEVFGAGNFINDISRIKCNPKNFSRSAYGNFSDMILFYAKNRDRNIWNNVTETLTSEQEKRLFPKIHPTQGRYTTNPLHAPGATLDGDTGKPWKGMLPPKGRHWRYSRAELSRLDNEGLIEWSSTGNPRKMVFASEHRGKKIQDVWEFKDKGLSYADYPTQKNHDLLERIILNSSEPGSLVLDCFAGSGGTLLTADRLGRRWIGIDNSLHSLETVRRSFTRNRIACNYYNYVSLD